MSEKDKMIKKLFAKTGEQITVEQTFWCDYGYNIFVGENFYMNHNCTILDGAKVEFGDNVVIGAGSIVNKDIPSNSVAVGNPCKVIKEI